MQLDLLEGLSVRVLSLARVNAVVLPAQRADIKVAPGAPPDDLVVPVQVLPADLAVLVPPGDGGVRDRRGDARKVDRILVPAPLVRRRLLLERRRELNL